MPWGPYDLGGVRTVHRVEDVHELISRLGREETPVVSRMPVRSTRDVHYQWQTDSLKAVNNQSSMAIGGNMPVVIDTVRVDNENYCQIVHEQLTVSKTQEAVQQYGLDSERNYQRAKKTIELKIDLEACVVSDATQQAPTPANLNIGLMDGLATQIATNVDAAGVFSQALFDTLMATIYNAGGSPEDVYCDATRKQAISNFTGTDRRAFQPAREVIDTVEVYEGDFGRVRVHYHHLLPQTVGAAATDAEVLILDHGLLELRELNGLEWEVMAKTGLAHNELGSWELTLANRNELGHGSFENL